MTGSRRFRLLLALGVFAVIATVAYFALREQRDDIDINSGKRRSQVCVGPIVLSETIRETPFSKLMAESNVSGDPLWRRVHTYGLFGGHGRYGWAASELKRFVIVCEDLHIDQKRQRVLGRQLLLLLRDQHFEESEKLIDNLSNGSTSGAAH